MPLTDEQLDHAVRDGIISPEQRRQLGALAARPAADTGGERAPAIVIAYAAGAVTVLFSFGWFLVERWEQLGAGGILAVVLVYAAMFAAASWWLARERFPLAASFAALLAIGMTPIATWAVLEMSGLWGRSAYGEFPGPYPANDGIALTRWAIVELTTALAALLAYRSTRFAPLALPVAVAGWLAPLHLAAPFFSDRDIAAAMFGWGSLATGSGLLLAAYVADRRTGTAAPTPSGLAFDPAGWIYRVAVFAMFIAVMSTWNDSGIVRHGILVLALVGVTFALSLGRTELLVMSAAAFVAWLGYLAFDVFDRVLSFPVVLATFGILLILLTVMVQRRWPALAARLAAARTGERRLPGGYAIPAALFALCVVLLAVAPARVAERLQRQHREYLRTLRESRQARQADAVRRRGETRRVPGP